MRIHHFLFLFLVFSASIGAFAGGGKKATGLIFSDPNDPRNWGSVTATDIMREHDKANQPKCDPNYSRNDPTICSSGKTEFSKESCAWECVLTADEEAMFERFRRKKEQSESDPAEELNPAAVSGDEN